MIFFNDFLTMNSFAQALKPSSSKPIDNPNENINYSNIRRNVASNSDIGDAVYNLQSQLNQLFDNAMECRKDTNINSENIEMMYTYFMNLNSWCKQMMDMYNDKLTRLQASYDELSKLVYKK